MAEMVYLATKVQREKKVLKVIHLLLYNLRDLLVIKDNLVKLVLLVNQVKLV